MVTFILQALFLIAAAFIAGAVLGNIFKRLSPQKPSAADGSTRAADERLASQARLVAGNDDAGKSAAQVAAMVPPAEPVPPRGARPARKAAVRAPAPEVAPRNPRQDDAHRPSLLAKARRGKPDRLSDIDGIGAAIESRLFALGIFHFDQIAAWSLVQADWVSIEIGFPGRAVRESWVKQAAGLAKSAPAKGARKPARGSSFG